MNAMRVRELKKKIRDEVDDKIYDTIENNRFTIQRKEVLTNKRGGWKNKYNDDEDEDDLRLEQKAGPYIWETKEA